MTAELCATSLRFSDGVPWVMSSIPRVCQEWVRPVVTCEGSPDDSPPLPGVSGHTDRSQALKSPAASVHLTPSSPTFPKLVCPWNLRALPPLFFLNWTLLLAQRMCFGKCHASLLPLPVLMPPCAPGSLLLTPSLPPPSFVHPAYQPLLRLPSPTQLELHTRLELEVLTGDQAPAAESQGELLWKVAQTSCACQCLDPSPGSRAMDSHQHPLLPSFGRTPLASLTSLCLLPKKCHHPRTGITSNLGSQLGTTCQHVAQSWVPLSSTTSQNCSGPSSLHPCSLLTPGRMLSALGTSGQRN